MKGKHSLWRCVLNEGEGDARTERGASAKRMEAYEGVFDFGGKF